MILKKFIRTCKIYNETYSLWQGSYNQIPSKIKVDLLMSFSWDGKPVKFNKTISEAGTKDDVNSIILNTRKTIFQAKIDSKSSSLSHLKANVKQVFVHDRYKHNHKTYIFEKLWSLLLEKFT